MSAAKATTDIAERVLNEKFDILGANLASRVNPFPSTRKLEKLREGCERGSEGWRGWVCRECWRREEAYDAEEDDAWNTEKRKYACYCKSTLYYFFGLYVIRHPTKCHVRWSIHKTL